MVQMIQISYIELLCFLSPHFCFSFWLSLCFSASSASHMVVGSTELTFFTADILTCHIRRSAGVNNKVKHGLNLFFFFSSFLFLFFCFRVLVLCMLPHTVTTHWDTSLTLWKCICCGKTSLQSWNTFVFILVLPLGFYSSSVSFVVCSCSTVRNLQRSFLRSWACLSC